MDFIKLVLVSFFVAVLLVGCGEVKIEKEVEIQVGNAQPTLLPTMDIEATVEARVQEELHKIPSVPTPTPSPVPTPTATVVPVVASPVVAPAPRPTGGRPADRYACVINVDGYCIFTGSPHELSLKPGTEEIIDREGNPLFSVKEAVAVNASGTILAAKGTPAFDGDTLIQGSKDGMTNDEKVFHRVMAIMFPVRNALMYDIPFLTQVQWDELVSELQVRGIKETTFTKGATPRDNYYGRQGIFDLAKNPKGRDIHHDMMKFLEESGLYLLCHVTSDEFNEMLRDTHPENHDPCADAEITSKISFGAS